MNRLLGAVRRSLRRVLILRARDVTDEVATRSLLVLSPHPDDETLGCGARVLISRAAGCDVTIVVATDGSASHGSVGTDRAALRVLRSQELKTATAHLGVAEDDLLELGFPDGALADHVGELAAELRRIIAARRPDDICVTCAAEPHPDHAAAAIALRRAVAELHPQPRLVEYPIWLWSNWPISRKYRRGSALREWFSLLVAGEIETVRVDAVRSSKRRAVEAYSSQLGGATTLGSGSSSASVALPRELVDRAVSGPELYFRRSVTGGL